MVAVAVVEPEQAAQGAVEAALLGGRAVIQVVVPAAPVQLSLAVTVQAVAVLVHRGLVVVEAAAQGVAGVVARPQWALQAVAVEQGKIL
jgi:hypothetical protein